MARLERLGLPSRLFAALALVVCAGAGTLLAVALLIAPTAFDTHLRRSGAVDLTPGVLTHVDRAFTQATLISLTAAITVAIIAAGLIAWLIARRLAAPVAGLAAATTRIADGNYDTDLADPRLGPEFAALTRAVNQLGRKLATSEQTRRRLLADLGHELRTPIAALEATVEAITDGVLPVDEETLTTLADQASRLRRLSTDLESVSRAEERQLALHPQPARLADLARRAANALRPRYQAADVDLRTSADEPGPTVTVDHDRLVEALMNLLDNALRHTPPGGVVTVTTDWPDGGPARVTVVDTGEGFPPDRAAHLFERFYRTDPARGHSAAPPGHGPGRHGSGIGLTITQAIIRAHHGNVTAHSAGPGEGATFTVTLPATTPRRSGTDR
ncbi:sensor histidine kinase [Mangrovihabitans endophyticus]|uniref:histidine kinase n=1 Tax=Mangrovihabitans endophyticus TaxID=1751298 RepID=A0A8J3C510_9ACTN|nr:HAMP domain-containing sensor histidine kinase [Mangrovihabitans endophyticus]GGL10426.1 putative sensor histidine kinase [Mangrovihabitans endophyticus]